MPKNEKPLIVLIVGTFVLLAACSLSQPGSPPYVVTKPVCAIGERTGYYHYAGVEFEFLNTSGKTVSRITVSFMLFDAETEKNPLVGSNLFKLDLLGTVYANEKKEMIIPLDPYIYVAPADPYIIDFFYIKEIRYTDGSSWEDEYGTYHTGSQ
jgi:hypothetical protein